MLRVLFWNVSNLFEPGVVERGPRSQRELDAKIDVLAEVIRDAFGNKQDPADLIGLAEIQNEAIFLRLARRLGAAYHHLWSGTADPGQTGIGILARKSAVFCVDGIDSFRPTMLQRPRAVVTDCKLASSGERFLFVVNHWKSRMVQSGSQVAPAQDRAATAGWLEELLAARARHDCVIAVGDFNAEPFEPEFGEFRLRSVRHFSTALWTAATPAYLYNTAWRTLVEPRLWRGRKALGTGGADPRPKTSHDASPPVVFDQLLVSGAAPGAAPSP